MGAPGTATAVGLALGWAADQLLGDPRRWHPVAGFGRRATALEDRTYADDRLTLYNLRFTEFFTFSGEHGPLGMRFTEFSCCSPCSEAVFTRWGEN